MSLLNGLKVLDLSRILAGPYAAQILGDLGANVIKIEAPEGDETRRWGPPYIDQNAAYFYTANRNKRSLALNFKNAEDLAHLRQLVREADVLIENFKTDSLKKFQLDYDSLKKENPRLIYCSITGYGHEGSKKHNAGFDAMIQAETGLMSVTGPPGQPSKTGIAISDLSTGLYAVIAIQAALLEREQSDQGQHIDLALFDVQLSLMTNVALNFLSSGQTPKAWGTAHPNIVPYQVFECLDRPLFLAVGNDRQFSSLCQVLKTSWAEDERFSKNSARIENRDELCKNISELLKKETRDHWLKLFEKHTIPASPLNNFDDLNNSDYIKEKNLFATTDDGKTPNLPSPMHFSRTPVTHYQTPPTAPEKEYFSFKS